MIDYATYSQIHALHRESGLSVKGSGVEGSGVEGVEGSVYDL